MQKVLHLPWIYSTINVYHLSFPAGGARLFSSGEREDETMNKKMILRLTLLVLCLVMLGLCAVACTPAGEPESPV